MGVTMPENSLKIINSLEESYFFKENDDSPFMQGNKLTFSKLKKLTDEEFKEQLKFVEDVYKNACVSQGQGGRSKSMNTDYLKGFFIHYYRKGGFAITPVYLIFNEKVGFKQVDNSDFKEHNEKMKHIYNNFPDQYQDLAKSTFNHVLPEGAICEYLIEKYNSKTLEKAYREVTKMRTPIVLKESLDKQLPQNTETKNKRMKI
jgi:hypothetical protein